MNNLVCVCGINRIMDFAPKIKPFSKRQNLVAHMAFFFVTFLCIVLLYKVSFPALTQC